MIYLVLLRVSKILCKRLTNLLCRIAFPLHRRSQEPSHGYRQSARLSLAPVQQVIVEHHGCHSRVRTWNRSGFAALFGRGNICGWVHTGTVAQKIPPDKPPTELFGDNTIDIYD